MVSPIQALPTAVTIFHELPFKSNTALRADKETDILENHKVGNHFRDTKLGKGQQEAQGHGYPLRISFVFHSSSEVDIRSSTGTPRIMLKRETRSAEGLDFSPRSRAPT